MKKKYLILLISAGLLALAAFAFFYATFLMPNISPRSGEEEYLYIYENSSHKDLLNQLDEKANIKSRFLFNSASKALRFKNVRSGRYIVEPGMSNLTLVRNLRNGNQTPVMLTFNNIRTKEQLAGRLAQQLMPDSLEILALMRSEAYLSQFDLDTLNAVSLFLPDTYEMFWNVSGQGIFNRMKREYDRFWTEERKAKAAAIPLTMQEVSVLASVVDGETNYVPEKPIVAGLYINRLRKGIPLQADPTVIFGVGDFSIRRVLNVHLRHESPYNTYLNRGLPPGPIRIPTTSALDAVLNYDKNDYIYMCAKETFDGQHSFAVSYAEHKRNAARYHKALTERGVMK